MMEHRESFPAQVELFDLAWRKSGASGSTDNACVEVARGCGVTFIRDSKHGRNLCLAIPGEAWATFLTNLTSGRSGRQ